MPYRAAHYWVAAMITSSLQTNTPRGLIQNPVTVLCYYGPGDPATGAGGSGIVSRDAAGQYWCDGKRFSHIHFALDYAEAHHD